MLIDFNGLNLFGYTEICVEIKPPGLLMSHKAPPPLTFFYIFIYLFIYLLKTESLHSPG